MKLRARIATLEAQNARLTQALLLAIAPRAAGEPPPVRKRRRRRKKRAVAAAPAETEGPPVVSVEARPVRKGGYDHAPSPCNAGRPLKVLPTVGAEQSRSTPTIVRPALPAPAVGSFPVAALEPVQGPMPDERPRMLSGGTNPNARFHLTRAERAELVEYPADVERPRTRGECAEVPRPCPFVACRYHLFLDVSADGRNIKLNFPSLAPDQLTESCCLDVADRGELTLERVGDILALTRERVRQVEEAATRNARDAGELEPWRAA